jgi:hypothetical protein
MAENNDNTPTTASGTTATSLPNGTPKPNAENKTETPATSRTDTPQDLKVEPKQAPDAAKTTADASKEGSAK